MSKDMITAVVYKAIKKVAGVCNINEDTCLIDRNTGIHPADFLYIFDEIENELGVSINSIFIHHTHEVFIVKNFINAINELCENGNVEGSAHMCAD